MTYNALDILFPNYLSNSLFRCFLSTLNAAEVPTFMTFRKQYAFSPSLIAFVMLSPLFSISFCLSPFTVLVLVLC